MKNIKSRGFTLIEILAALAILAIVISVATPAILNNIRRARINTTKLELSNLEQALTTFQLDCGFLPTSDQGLQSLITAPTGKTCKNFDPEGYLKKKEVNLDPWQNAYNYLSPGQKRPTSYDLWSSGPDGISGNEDDVVAGE